MLFARQAQTIFTPQTAGLIALLINRRAETIKVTFGALYLLDDVCLGKSGCLDAVNLGNFANFLHVHSHFLLPLAFRKNNKMPC